MSESHRKAECDSDFYRMHYRIEELEAENAALKAALARLRDLCRWIPVGERLPEEGSTVIGEYWAGLIDYRKYLYLNGSWLFWQGHGLVQADGPSSPIRWHPLPPEPEGKG